MAQSSKGPKGRISHEQQMAHILFKQVVSDQKLKEYTSLPTDKLKMICKQGGYLFYRKLMKKPNQVLAFLSNFHGIIMGYSSKVSKQILNNISLHFILLSSYALIQNGNTSSAKQLLKKSLNYIGSTNPDRILLTTALNNLCVLWMNQQKYYKSINILIEMTQIMEQHIKQLKHSARKNQIMEDSVFLINSYYLLSKCLKNVIQKNHKSFYRDLYHYSNRIGLKKAIKYLGRQSFLTIQFLKIVDEKQLELPIFIQQQQQKSVYEQKLMKKLISIEQLLNKPRYQPVVVKQIERTTPILQVSQPPPSQLPSVSAPPAQNHQQTSLKYEQDLICACNRKIRDWDVEVQILKEKSQKLGNVVINSRRGKESVNLIISQQRVFKLLTQMNTTDILPDECSLNNLAPHEFVQFFIFPFFEINDNKNIEIFPRAHCVIDPFSVNVFGKQTIVFFYHIRWNQFRLAFGQKGQAETYYLEVELNQLFMAQILEIKHQVEQRIYQVYETLMDSEQKENNFKYTQQIKEITVKNGTMIVSEVERILKNFEVFIQNHLSDATLEDIFKQQNQFFKYCQGHHNPNKFDEGRFYYIRYLTNIKGFDIYIENTYESYKPDGKAKAKGNTLYNSAQFLKDFGISSQNALLKFKCFCQILCRKYTLKSFQSPLTTKDLQTYQQNSISQVKITCKTYLRKMRQHKHNILPLTACIVSVNNEIPVGVKLTGYNCITCFEVGYFIFVPHGSWRWPEKREEQVSDFINGVVQQYGYKKDYFLVDWLERFGFQVIIDLLKIDNEDNFFIEGVNSNFLRIQKVIDSMK